MCLTVFNKNTNPSSAERCELMKPEVADNPIMVYKVLRKTPTGSYQTPYQDTHVRFRFWRSKMESFAMCGNAMFQATNDYLYWANRWKTWSVQPDGKVEFVDSPYDDVDFTAKRIEREGLIPVEFSVTGGIHAFVDVPCAEFFKDWFNATKNLMTFEGSELVVFKATIPKGTRYYVGLEGDIVAEKMIIHKKKVMTAKKSDYIIL